MSEILVLGAGQSSPYLIQWLLERAGERGWHVTVADTDRAAAAARIDGHPRGSALELDVADPQERGRRFDAADIVVNLLPPRFELPVAFSCVEHDTPMVTASYLDPAVAALDADARKRGVLLLTEMGLDPGIDLMSTMELLEQIRERDGRVISYESYGSGVPDPAAVDNPFTYAITWNPRNVVMAGQEGALFRRDGRLRAAPAPRLFRTTWPVHVPELGAMEAYPNRDSLRYIEPFDLDDCPTVIRGTLRFPGWCETWHQVVQLGLPLETLRVPGLEAMTWRELIATFLPDGRPGPSDPSDGEAVAQATAEFLGLEVHGPVMNRLRWLGFFSDTPIGEGATTPAQALVLLLRSRLHLAATGRDLVILHHRLGYERPDGTRGVVTSSLREWGQPGGVTAMARTVGLPIALAVERILSGELNLSGAHIPTHPAIYRPLLAALAAHGVRFEDAWEEQSAA
ncbi:MAG: saccharopine dehydrogenase C-terminal domain-containing protein [Gemmatimonadota bacterium]